MNPILSLDYRERKGTVLDRQSSLCQPGQGPVQLRAQLRGPPSTRMVSFLLCLLPALLATTSAQTIPSATLTCKTCFGQTKECSFVPGICQDNKATGGCLSVAEDIKLDGTQDMSFFKQCLSSYKSDIKVPISFTVGNGQYVRINTARCNDADNCNSGALEVPTGSTTENGLQCPTCFALNFTVCNSTITPCTGDETYCLDFTGFLKNGPSSSPFQAKGCATASAQDIKPGSTLISTPYTFSFYWGATVPAEKIPTVPPPTTTTALETTPPTPNPTPTPSPATTPTPTPNATPSPAPTTPPTPNPTPTTTRPAPTTPPPKTSTTTKRTTLPKTTPATTDGASPALGKFSFALYLPGLTGLLLVKLLS
ncbi:unnamed protein product [Lepidochelys kempii]